MARSASLGMPRVGLNGELPELLSKYFSRQSDSNDNIVTAEDVKKIIEVGKTIRFQNYKMQLDAGVDIIPCNDFTFFDNVLDTSTLLGNVPRRYFWEGGEVSFDIYYNMARGYQKDHKFDVLPLEVGRWFNTNYLYTVPELSDQVEFSHSDRELFDDYIEAKNNFNIQCRPVFLGPISYLLHGRTSFENEHDVDYNEFLHDMMPVYEVIFDKLKRIHITDIQIDEPFLVTNLTIEQQGFYKEVYNKFHIFANGKIKIHLTASYGSIGNNLVCALDLPVDSFHFDLVSAPEQLDIILNDIPLGMTVSLGLVDANNVWINDLSNSINIARKVIDKLGSDRVIIAPAASLFQCPLDVDLEDDFSADHKELLSFSKQKLREISIITKALNDGVETVYDELRQNNIAIKKLNAMHQEIARDIDSKANNSNENSYRLPFNQRLPQQKYLGNDYFLPITLVGALPSSSLIKAFDNDGLSAVYNQYVQNAISSQEKIGIDILVHGEAERTNDVEYFAQHLDGIIIPKKNVVQIYAHLCMKVPIVIKLPRLKEKCDPYTAIAVYAQSLTQKPFKMSLIGPITFTNSIFMHQALDKFSFYSYISSIVQDLMLDLEKNGIKIIHINENGVLNHLPLHHEEHTIYIKKISHIFKMMCSPLQPSTQIQTYVSYLKNEDDVEDLAMLDSDILLLETSRCSSRILNTFISYKFMNNIGLGVYDTLSDRIPTKPEIGLALRKSIRALDEEQIWVIPDGDFKHKKWSDCNKILSVLVSAVKEMRKSLQQNSKN